MTRNGGKVHVVRVRKTGYVDKQGRRKDYSSAYLRRPCLSTYPVFLTLTTCTFPPLRVIARS